MRLILHNAYDSAPGAVTLLTQMFVERGATVERVGTRLVVEGPDDVLLLLQAALTRAGMPTPAVEPTDA